MDIKIESKREMQYTPKIGERVRIGRFIGRCAWNIGVVILVYRG